MFRDLYRRAVVLGAALALIASTAQAQPAPLTVFAASTNADAAAYLVFLQGPQASAIFKRYGFIVLSRPR